MKSLASLSASHTLGIKCAESGWIAKNTGGPYYGGFLHTVWIICVMYCNILWGHVRSCDMCESYVWCTVTYCETMWGHVTRVTSWKHVVCMTVGVDILAPANFWYRRTGNFLNQIFMDALLSWTLATWLAHKHTHSIIAVYVVIAVCFDLLPSFPLPRRPCRGGVRRHSHPPVRGYRQNNWEPPAHGGNILW